MKKSEQSARMVFFLCIMTLGFYRCVVVYKFTADLYQSRAKGLFWAIACLLLPFPMILIHMIGLAGKLDAEAALLLGKNAKKCRTGALVLSFLCLFDVAIWLMQRQWNRCARAELEEAT